MCVARKSRSTKTPPNRKMFAIRVDICEEDGFSNSRKMAPPLLLQIAGCSNEDGLQLVTYRRKHSTRQLLAAELQNFLEINSTERLIDAMRKLTSIEITGKNVDEFCSISTRTLPVDSCSVRRSSLSLSLSLSAPTLLAGSSGFAVYENFRLNCVR